MMGIPIHQPTAHASITKLNPPVIVNIVKKALAWPGLMSKAWTDPDHDLFKDLAWKDLAWKDLAWKDLKNLIITRKRPTL